MNITPEQIPDEVVEAAVAAWLEHPDVGSVQSMYSGMAYALAAALPVLLGEPVAWQTRNFFTYGYWSGWSQEFSEDEAIERVRRYAELGIDAQYRTLYTLPTQDTHNADQ